jgi:hypothetical protein
MLGDLASAAGNSLIHRSASVNGFGLQQHWEKVEAFERDPRTRDGRYETGRSLREELQAEPWDFVTIQQVSILSHDVSTYRPYAANLRDYIARWSPTAQVLLHQTWAYRSDDPQFLATSTPAPGQPASEQEMYTELTEAYQTIATELGTRVIPVGDAFFRADTDSNWGYKTDVRFDPATATYPRLPDQKHSLHTGWQWTSSSNGTWALTMDGHHASIPGRYLAACVFYDFLFADNVENNPLVAGGIAPEHAQFLRRVAHEAVTTRRNDGADNDVQQDQS